ncbi:MAG: tetratricopeptide repeat protein [Micavibrio sp.]
MKTKLFFLTMFAVAASTTACTNMPDMKTAKYADKQKDYKTSIDHYQRLAEFGLPEAKVELGKHYLGGKGVEKNPQKALALFKDANSQKANKSTAKFITRSQTQLGALSLTGKSGTLPPQEGVAFLKKAAEAGDARALFELGKAYEKGIGVPQNTQTAMDYYSKAGALGYGRADYSRAALYEKGNGVPQDVPQAIALYEMAAQKDYPRANLNLARLYEKGLGVEQNLQLAEAYYQKAENQGVPVDNDQKKLQKN